MIYNVYRFSALIAHIQYLHFLMYDTKFMINILDKAH